MLTVTYADVIMLSVVAPIFQSIKAEENKLGIIDTRKSILSKKEKERKKGKNEGTKEKKERKREREKERKKEREKE
jgi:hypothetical protein